MKTEDLFVLCALKSMPEQRVVHQHACSPDPTGHVVAPEAVYFRRWGSGALSVKKPVFRRLLKTGYLLRIVAATGDGPQDEYGLSEAAHAKFGDDHLWQEALFFFRQHVQMKRVA